MPPENKTEVVPCVYLDGRKLENFSMEPVEIEPERIEPVGDLHSVPHYRCGNCFCAIVLFENDPKPEQCRWCGAYVKWD